MVLVDTHCHLYAKEFAADIDAVIKTGVPNYPVVNSNASCHAVSTMPGASVIVNTGFKLDVVGQ